MTEKEKSAAGLLYDANGDQALIQERNHAHHLNFEYNSIDPLDLEKRTSLMKSFLGKTGESFLVEQPFYCDYGYNISVGENFYANFGCVILDCAQVTIGDNVFLAPQVGIHTAGHPLDTVTRLAGLEYARPITIGNDVWIGAGAIILPGVSIGNGSVIGAGSIVTKSIPAGVVAAGNPCRVIKAIEQEG